MPVVAAGLVAAMLPVFLLGTLSPRIGAELGLSEAGVGLALSIFFTAAALSAVPGGRVADRIGAGAALRFGVLAAAAAMAGVGLAVTGTAGLLVLLVGAGAALGLVDPGGSRALSAAVPLRRQGLAFGVKEASVPTASLLAGASLPLVVGWRASFVAGGVLAALIAAAVPRGLDASRARSHPRPPASSGTPAAAVFAVAAASALGGGAAVVGVTFLVPAALDRGWSEPAAGGLLVTASLTGIAVRLAVGLLADRRPGAERTLLAVALLLGAVGLAGLGTGPLLTAALLAVGAGWGWTGLAFLAAVRLDPDRPARAAGMVLTGLAIGGAIGPAGFGWIVTRAGFPRAWLLAAAAMAAAALLIGVAAHRARQAGDPG